MATPKERLLIPFSERSDRLDPRFVRIEKEGGRVVIAASGEELLDFSQIDQSLTPTSCLMSPSGRRLLIEVVPGISARGCIVEKESFGDNNYSLYVTTEVPEAQLPPIVGFFSLPSGSSVCWGREDELVVLSQKSGRNEGDLTTNMAMPPQLELRLHLPSNQEGISGRGSRVKKHIISGNLPPSALKYSFLREPAGQSPVMQLELPQEGNAIAQVGDKKYALMAMLRIDPDRTPGLAVDPVRNPEVKEYGRGVYFPCLAFFDAGKEIGEEGRLIVLTPYDLFPKVDSSSFGLETSALRMEGLVPGENEQSQVDMTYSGPYIKESTNISFPD